MAASEPWYVTAFRGGYRDVYPHRDLASARREAAWLLAHDVRGRVLDLCCGFGRHSLALTEYGCDVFGLDLSLDLLRAAHADEHTRAIAHRLVRGDARELPFATGSFDSVVVLFSSFGYFGRDGDARMLAEIARVLRPEGRAVLDLMNPARVRAALVPHSVTQRGEQVVDERRRIEPGAADGGPSSIVVKDVVLTGPGGVSRSWTERVGLYELGALERALRAHGLGPTGVHGDFDATQHSATSPRQIVVVRRT
ncbi:MAG: methyltransferase domain-containing protein [Planctomycetes bacterium]|nr:methyltransferase domain-containing protein [Planctomycetota bacterium]